MATTQPTPLPIPTTSEQTVHPFTITVDVSTNDGSDGTELRVSTTSETATDQPILSSSESTDVGLITGVVVIVIVVIATAVTMVILIVAVLFKKRHGKKTTVAIHTTANQAYGLDTHHNKELEESNIYNYPEVDHDNITIETKQNDAYNYATNTDIITEGNQAYATSIITEENQAYATNITTEKNTAYKPVTTVETVNVYEYI